MKTKIAAGLILLLVLCVVLCGRLCRYQGGYIEVYPVSTSRDGAVWLRTSTEGETLIVYISEDRGKDFELRFSRSSKDVRRLLNSVAQECRGLGIAQAEPADFGRQGVSGPRLELRVGGAPLLEDAEYFVQPLPDSIADIAACWVKEAEAEAAERKIVKKPR